MPRQVFDISTDTGTQGDTGQPIYGSITQIGWDPTTGDTGGDLSIIMRPTNTEDTDTGAGWTIYNNNDCLGSDFLQAVRQVGVSSDGTDTGVDEYFPIHASGDHLRIKVTPGGAAVVGKLYIYINGL